MDRRSELPSVAAARARRDLHLEKRLESNRTTPTDARFNAEPTTWVFTKRFGLGRVAQPNGVRLSCGRELCGSAGEQLSTRRSSGAQIKLLACARQLQALVRRRSTRQRRMQGFRCNIRTVWPHHGAAVEEEAPEYIEVLEWLKHWPLEPPTEVHRPLRPVAEHEVDAVGAPVLGLSNARQLAHAQHTTLRAQSAQAAGRRSFWPSWLRAPAGAARPSAPLGAP